MHPLVTHQLALHHQDDVAREAIAARGATATSNPVPFRLHALGPPDRRRVEAGFDRLSEATVRSRFLGPVKATPRLFDWVDELDGWDQIAVAASHAESGAPLGLARFVRDEHDPTRADVAITVIDGWQRRGVGTALMEKLARRAAAVGITTFSATAFAENHGARALARKLGRIRMGPTGRGVMSLDIRIVGGLARRPPAKRRSPYECGLVAPDLQ
jgi:RimJ/RimL family protein N-acetyltransferase